MSHAAPEHGSRPTSSRRWRAAVAATALGAVGLVGVGAPPAAGDYAPYVVFAGQVSGGEVLHVAAGDEVSFENDPSGPCDTGAPVPWRFGVLEGTPEIAGPVTFTEVLRSGSVQPDEDGNWSVTFTVPADVADGSYAVSASCEGVPAPPDGPARQAAPTTLFDYFPAFLEVGAAPATTTTSVTATTTGAPPAAPVTAPPPAAALPGSADFTG